MKAALEKLDGQDLHGRRIRLQEDKSRRRRSRSRSRSRSDRQNLVRVVLDHDHVHDQRIVVHDLNRIDPSLVHGQSRLSTIITIVLVVQLAPAMKEEVAETNSRWPLLLQVLVPEADLILQWMMVAVAVVLVVVVVAEMATGMQLRKIVAVAVVVMAAILVLVRILVIDLVHGQWMAIAMTNLMLAAALIK